MVSQREKKRTKERMMAIRKAKPRERARVRLKRESPIGTSTTKAKANPRRERATTITSQKSSATTTVAQGTLPLLAYGQECTGRISESTIIDGSNYQFMEQCGFRSSAVCISPILRTPNWPYSAGDSAQSFTYFPQGGVGELLAWPIPTVEEPHIHCHLALPSQWPMHGIGAVVEHPSAKVP